MLRNKLKGFTLLEVLIALFIFTIVAVIMTRALHSVLTTQAATEQHAEQLTDLQITLLLISRDLEQTIDRPVISAKGDQELSFMGASSIITFTHGGYDNPGGQLPRSTLQRTRYVLEKSDLMRETWPALDQAQKTKMMKRILLKNVSELQFEFLDTQRHFHDSWPPTDLQNPPSLPIAVRVSFTLQNWGKISQIYILPGLTFDPLRP